MCTYPLSGGMGFLAAIRSTCARSAVLRPVPGRPEMNRLKPGSSMSRLSSRALLARDSQIFDAHGIRHL